jgi:hypothetical protein
LLVNTLEGHGYGSKVIGLRFMMLRVLNSKRPLTCSMCLDSGVYSSYMSKRWWGGSTIGLCLFVCLFVQRRWVLLGMSFGYKLPFFEDKCGEGMEGGESPQGRLIKGREGNRRGTATSFNTLIHTMEPVPSCERIKCTCKPYDGKTCDHRKLLETLPPPHTTLTIALKPAIFHIVSNRI